MNKDNYLSDDDQNQEEYSKKYKYGFLDPEEPDDEQTTDYGQSILKDLETSQQAQNDSNNDATQQTAESYENYLKTQIPTGHENEVSKKRELEKGPSDFVPIMSSTMNEQNYYHDYYIPSEDMPFDSPYLGLERVIPNFDPHKLPLKVQQEIKDAVKEIDDNDCTNKKCAITKHHVKHIHCDGCGQPYQMEFWNYHDIANREPRCKTCGTPFDYGPRFNQTWSKIEKDVSELRQKELDRLHEENLAAGPEDAYDTTYDQNTEKDADHPSWNNGVWYKGTFVGDDGSVSYSRNMNPYFRGNVATDDPYDADDYQDYDSYVKQNYDSMRNSNYDSVYNDNRSSDDYDDLDY